MLIDDVKQGMPLQAEIASFLMNDSMTREQIVEVLGGLVSANILYLHENAQAFIAFLLSEENDDLSVTSKNVGYMFAQATRVTDVESSRHPLIRVGIMIAFLIACYAFANDYIPDEDDHEYNGYTELVELFGKPKIEMLTRIDPLSTGNPHVYSN